METVKFLMLLSYGVSTFAAIRWFASEKTRLAKWFCICVFAPYVAFVLNWVLASQWTRGIGWITLPFIFAAWLIGIFLALKILREESPAVGKIAAVSFLAPIVLWLSLGIADTHF